MPERSVRVHPDSLAQATMRISGLAGLWGDASTALSKIASGVAAGGAWQGQGGDQFQEMMTKLADDLATSKTVFIDVLHALTRLQADITHYEVQFDLASQNAAHLNHVAQSYVPHLTTRTGSWRLITDDIFANVEEMLAREEPNFSTARGQFHAQLDHASARLNDAAQQAPSTRWMHVDIARRGHQPAIGRDGFYMPVIGTVFSGRPTGKQVYQGNFAGDCYLLASLAAIANTHPHWLEQHIRSLGPNTYEVELFINGKWRWYKVDANLPRGSGEIAREGAMGQAVLWPALFEKAYAEARGSYDRVENGGFAGDALKSLTGRTAEYIDTAYTGLEGTKKFILDAISQGHPITFGSFDSQQTGPGTVDVVTDHEYFLQSYDPKTGLLQLGNPWGYNNPPPMTLDEIFHSFEQITRLP